MAGGGVDAISRALAEEYARQSDEERTLRLWTKVATLGPSMILARTAPQGGVSELISELRQAARGAAGEIFPWEQ